MSTVITDGYVSRDIYGDAYEMVQEFPGDVAAVARWAAHEHHEQVWLMPCPMLAQAMRHSGWWLSGDIGGCTVTVLGDEEAPTGALVRQGVRIVCRIMRVDDPRWHWHDVKHDQLAADLRHLAELLGVPVAISPQSTGIRMLTRAGCLREPSPWPLGKRPVEPMAANLAWVRRIERDYEWIHVIDRNAAYLNAARNSTFGAGEPEHLQEPVFDALVPGLWRLREDVGMGNHLLPNDGLGKGEWHDTAVLEWACELGYAPMVHDAWLWPERKRTLRPWANVLANAREMSRGRARQVVKAIATTTIGMFNHARANERTAWYRPDWWAHIQAVNLLTVGQTIRRLEEDGCAVLVANTDMLAVLSDSREFPKWLEMSDRIGKWKYDRHAEKARYWQNLVRDGATLVDWLRQWRGQ